MSIGALAANLWHNATSALASPKSATLGFTASTGKPSGPAAPAQPNAAPSNQQLFDDLHSWVLAQQPSATTSATASQARAAYAATSALGRAAP